MIQYGRALMGDQRRQLGTRVLLVLAVALASLWAGGLAGGGLGAGDRAGQLAAGRSPAGIDAAVAPQPAPSLRPASERPEPAGRQVPLLLGALAAALALASQAPAGERRPGSARARSQVPPAPRGARAPPGLQPA
jgi:hypothetical protein